MAREHGNLLLAMHFMMYLLNARFLFWGALGWVLGRDSSSPIPYVIFAYIHSCFYLRWIPDIHVLCHTEMGPLALSMLRESN